MLSETSAHGFMPGGQEVDKSSGWLRPAIRGRATGGRNQEMRSWTMERPVIMGLLKGSCDAALGWLMWALLDGESNYGKTLCLRITPASTGLLKYTEACSRFHSTLCLAFYFLTIKNIIIYETLNEMQDWLYWVSFQWENSPIIWALSI